MKLTVEQTQAIVEQANYFVWLVRKIRDFPKGKDSGYCVVKDAATGRLLLAFQIGECPAEKVEKYLRLANEKADRLIANIGAGHKSSWQSRDGKEKWGGAIRAGKLIFSFSGLPELADEAVMLCTAEASRTNSPLIPYAITQEIACISNNDVFLSLVNLSHVFQNSMH